MTLRTGRRYKLRFNVFGFDPERLRVVTDGERIIVRGTKLEESHHGVTTEREYEKKIEKPKEVDHTRLKSFLTTDGILIIEAPLPPKSLNLRKANHANSSPQRSSHGGSSTSLRSASPASVAVVAPTGSAVVASTSNGAPSAPSPTRERYCVPVFFDDNGRRKMSLSVDIGLAFAAKEITVMIIKENRIQIKGRHEERTAEKLCKRKYTKEFELPERIETYSLRGGLTVDGKLIVSALGKGHAVSLNKVTAGELIEDDINARAENHSCNVLDLSTFPPTTPQLIASSYNN